MQSDEGDVSLVMKTNIPLRQGRKGRVKWREGRRVKGERKRGREGREKHYHSPI